VKTTIFLKNIEDFEQVNNIYKNYFVLKPARSTIEVSKLPKNALIEIEVIAKR
jgi:2-iminobutanoate/2-iminopropanoate deaminase